MKIYKISLFMLSAAFLTTACSDIDNQEPEGGSLTKEQTQETNVAIPERMQATFSGMFSMMGRPHGTWPTGGNSNRADDFGFVMSALSLDLEGADVHMPDVGYNWFSTCGEYSSRNANYANPYIRYVTPYRQIGICNEIIGSYAEDTQDPAAINQIAQARAMRAFDYMSLAPYFQATYATAKDKPCIPILKPGTDYANNPRATVAEVWEYIIEDLNYAIEHLTAERPSKDQININVAYGLRARANLVMQNWQAAADDAAKAMEGLTPATMSEVGVPAFYDINDHNWIWGINITTELQGLGLYCTSSSWLSAFSGDGYAAATQVTPMINNLLYAKISDTDVRKGWWLDANLHSPNWAGLSWTDPKTGATATGDELGTFTIQDVKEAYLPLTSIKFGMKSGVGSTINNNDWPLMRVEEMVLIRAEALAKAGNEPQGRQVLEDFVKTYRDPSYSSTASGRSFENEVWYQRRVELWGEGFFMFDARRLNKPIVRFHNKNNTNLSEAFVFNIAADDAWLNMRFPQTEMDNNFGIVDNSGSQIPTAGQNPNLRDGVTD